MNAGPTVPVPNALSLRICPECSTPLLMENGTAKGLVEIDLSLMTITPHDSICALRPKPLGYGVYPT